MKCPECGFENKSDAKFCVNCGAELEKGVPKREYPIKVKIKTMEEKASRIELFVRIVYGFVLSIIAGIWGMLAFITAVIHWFYILVCGKKEESLWKFYLEYLRFVSKLDGYIYMLTDERPPITGADVEYPIKFSAIYEESASRLELFIRIVYGFVLSIIAGIWGFFAEIAAVIQWFYILIMGKRNGSLWGFIAGYMRYYFRLQGYVTLLTDERPPISGEEI